MPSLRKPLVHSRKRKMNSFQLQIGLCRPLGFSQDHSPKAYGMVRHPNNTPHYIKSEDPLHNKGGARAPGHRTHCLYHIPCTQKLAILRAPVQAQAAPFRSSTLLGTAPAHAQRLHRIQDLYIPLRLQQKGCRGSEMRGQSKTCLTSHCCSQWPTGDMHAFRTGCA